MKRKTKQKVGESGLVQLPAQVPPEVKQEFQEMCTMLGQKMTPTIRLLVEEWCKKNRRIVAARLRQKADQLEQIQKGG